MLAKSSKLIHPINGSELRTPLLVKSFSSKGFKYSINKRTKNINSEVFDIIKNTRDILTSSILISAYDWKHFLPSPKSLAKIINPEFVFIDSGGYETIDGYDLSEAYQHPVYRDEKLVWNENEHQALLDSLPNTTASIIISYDNGNEKKIRLPAQIKRARKLFERYPKSLHDFLIKSSSANGYLNIDEILNHITQLKGFHIIGLTEKELGQSTIERMVNIKTIRTALTNVGILTPLHIFGSLDPITSVLYFLAGAEIFDGLTWLRYAYHDGLCIYRENYNVLNERFTDKDSNNSFITYYDNNTYLNNLQGEMRNFLREYPKTGSEAFKCFNSNSAFIKRCFEQFASL